MTPRLKADIWIKALIRRCEVVGAFAAVVRKGDDTAGSLILKVNTLDGRAIALAPSYTLEGHRVWRPQPQTEPVAESEVDAYIARASSRDPDLWVVEIEDRQGRHFLDEPVE
jgi:hypothetical protein